MKQEPSHIITARAAGIIFTSLLLSGGDTIAERTLRNCSAQRRRAVLAKVTKMIEAHNQARADREARDVEASEANTLQRDKALDHAAWAHGALVANAAGFDVASIQRAVSRGAHDQAARLAEGQRIQAAARAQFFVELRT